MPRALKAFAQIEPRTIETAAPRTNQFTLDLAGLRLSDEQLRQVRQVAVKGAMEMAAGLLDRGGLGQSMSDFGTFSTFSTFSTFGSGAARPDIQPGRTERISPAAQDVIDKVVQPGG